jgi:hypothetical protein
MINRRTWQAASVVAGLTWAGMAWLGMASAHASTSSFQTRAQEEIPYVVSQYGSAAVLNEGYKVCGYAASGVTNVSDMIDKIVADMPMSRGAAMELEVLAEVHLGC